MGAHAGRVAGLCGFGPVLLLSAGSAAAQDRPPAQPTRDVAVTYSGMPNAALQMSWLAAAHLSRSQVAPGIWSLHDQAQYSTVLVNDALKAIIVLPMPDPMLTGASPDARFTREGSATVAGIGCTSWAIRTGAADASACIAAAGVPLRMEATNIVLTATEVSYTPQDPGRFAVPAGYKREGPG